MINGQDPRARMAVDATDLNAVKLAAKQDQPQALKAAAQQFEALFMNMMMKSMREATPGDSMFDSEQSRMYTSMLDGKLSENFARRGLGLADALMRQLSNNAGLSSTSPTTSVDPAAVTGNAATAKGAATVNGAAAIPGASANTSSTRSTSTDINTSSATSTGKVASADSGKRGLSLPGYVRAFRDKLAEHAKKASELTGIPANFMLGQAALESGWGRREIKAGDGSNSHNIFGVKAGRNWSGKTVSVATTEYVNGVPQKRIEKFRAYDSYAAAFEDYARTLANNPRYRNVLANAQDAKGFALSLQRAGYATDPNYAQKINRIIDRRLTA